MKRKENKKVYVSNRPNISMKELKKMFPYMSEKELEYEMQNNEWIKLEKFLAQVRHKNLEYGEKAEQPDVKRLVINVQWHRSRTWGNCPRASFSCTFADGTYLHGTETASGCGYDKESTVIAEIFTKCCSGMLWRKRNSKKEAPYGCTIKNTWFPHFSGGVGTTCYIAITAFLGGHWEHTDWTDNSDSYTITFPVKKAKKIA